MDGIQLKRPSLLFHLIGIGLFGSVLIGCKPGLALNGDGRDHDIAVFSDAAVPTRSTLSLHRLCKSSSVGDVSWCEGYLMGLADVLLAMGNSRMPGGICGADYDAAALTRVFNVWAEHHPERWKDDMAASVQASFREVWPCL
jgi:hypothetical protein